MQKYTGQSVRYVKRSHLTSAQSSITGLYGVRHSPLLLLTLAIVLVVLTPSTTQTTRGWFQQMSFLGECRAQMAVLGLVKDLAWQESVVYWWDSLMMLARHFSCGFCYISSTTKEPAQPCNLVPGLQSWSASILRSIPCPSNHLPPSTSL